MQAVGIQNEIVAAEINESNPMLDDAHGTTGILIDRQIRSLPTGFQRRREGIEDPLTMILKGLHTGMKMTGVADGGASIDRILL